jgi:ABC-type proline/glycine betaine transport system ATPase subunit
MQLAAMEGEGKTEMLQMLNKLLYQESENIVVFHHVIFLLPFVMKTNL